MVGGGGRAGWCGRGTRGYAVAHGREGGARGRRAVGELRERRVDGIAGHYSETRICSFVSSLCMRRGVCASFYRLKSRLRITVQMIFFSSAHSRTHPPPSAPPPPASVPLQPLYTAAAPSPFRHCLPSLSLVVPTTTLSMLCRAVLPRNTRVTDSKGI